MRIFGVIPFIQLQKHKKQNKNKNKKTRLPSTSRFFQALDKTKKTTDNWFSSPSRYLILIFFYRLLPFNYCLSVVL